MSFENLVVSTLDASLNPIFVNAGQERFKGVEAELTLEPKSLPGTSVSLGYAHHDARFIRFTEVDPDGNFSDVSGRRLEMVPRDMLSARLDLQAPHGIGVFGAVRVQGRRPLTRDNQHFLESYTEQDAGASFTKGRYRLSVIGRNLSDDRHYIAESELGDSQFYVAPPRRVTAEVSLAY